MPTKQRRGRDTIEQLLEAALTVYGERGQSGLTPTAVIEASGISVGSLYHHFGNFHDLQGALYDRCMSDMMDGLIAAVRPTRTARTGVHAIVTAYLQWTAAYPSKALVIHTSSHAACVPGQQSENFKAPGLNVIADWLAPHIAAGRVQNLPPAMIELLVIGPLAIAARRWLSKVPDIDLDEAARLLPERIWQSIRGPEG